MTRAADIASSFTTKLAEKAAEWLVDEARAQVERARAEREASRARWESLMEQARAGTWPPGADPVATLERGERAIAMLDQKPGETT